MKKIFKNYAFWFCFVGIIIARIIRKNYSNFLPEYIEFLITSSLPSIGILIGIYIEKNKIKIIQILKSNNYVH
jgi:hypothetical protein